MVMQLCLAQNYVRCTSICRKLYNHVLFAHVDRIYGLQLYTFMALYFRELEDK
jgi:hypothetical protein